MSKNNDIIIILARDSGTWVREKFSPSGITRWFGEGLISDYKEKMKVLREVDDKIYDWSEDLDRIVKEMKRAIKANRLVDVAVLIGTLNRKLYNIKNEGAKVQEMAEEALMDFDLDRGSRGHELPLPNLDDLKSQDGLVASAGVWSDFKRDWVNKRVENANRKARATALSEILKSAELTVKKVKEYVKKLGRARAEGNIGQYIVELKMIEEAQDNFREVFLPRFKEHLAPLVNRALAKNKVEQKPTDLGTLEAPAPVKPKLPKTLVDLGPLDVAEEEAPKTIPEGPITEAPKTEIPTTEDMIQPETKRSPLAAVGPEGANEEDEEPEALTRKKPLLETAALNEALLKLSHEKFLKELTKIADNTDDPYLMAAMIVHYAGKIEDRDLGTSLKLVSIAEGILGE